MGVQDFAPEVQEAIGRRQSELATRELYDYARRIGFESINLDLVYGLPLQTPEAFGRTLDTVVAMAPHRVAIYSYAHVPWLRPHQKQIPTSSLPEAALKFVESATDNETVEGLAKFFGKMDAVPCTIP